MNWAIPLLADPSPSLRLLVLRELLNRPGDDPEVRELAALRDKDPLIQNLLCLQGADGSWQPKDLAGNVPGGALQATSQALTRLGYLGLGPAHPAVQRGAAFLFAHQDSDGSWPLPRNSPDTREDGGYDMMPLQTALPLRGLAACGYATDARAELAYDWLLAQRLADGAWPTGIAAGNYGYVAGYRRLAHSRWGCRSNTTAALICLAYHPQRRSAPAPRRALDLLLGRETLEGQHVGYEVARVMGAEPASGWTTFFARFDLALILDLCGRLDAGLDDARVAAAVTFVRSLQGPHGLWPYPRHPEAARWVTFDLLRSLNRLGEQGEWQSTEPRTPFQPYARLVKRF